MSALPAGGRLLDSTRALPPRKQRILAPSTVTVIDSDMGAEQCVCALRVTDIVNLTHYYVPMTAAMCEALIAELSPHTQPSKVNNGKAA